MLESDLRLKLEALKRELEWKFWNVGRYADGIVYLEFENRYGTRKGTGRSGGSGASDGGVSTGAGSDGDGGGVMEVANGTTPMRGSTMAFRHEARDRSNRGNWHRYGRL